jgi:FdhD protein
VLMRLPGMEKELATGFCLSEGLVRSFNDVLLVHHCGQEVPTLTQGDDGPFSRNRVELQVEAGALNPQARLEIVRLIRAGCGAVDIDRGALPLIVVSGDLTVDAQVVLSLPQAMRTKQRLHTKVGGVHAAGLFDRQGQETIVCEDVGRHNAVDKAIGYCALRSLSVHDKLLLCSGRLSYEMATKAIRMEIPILVSVSAPTALAVDLAERFGLTLVGYARGDRMTVYTHPQRILLADDAPTAAATSTA